MCATAGSTPAGSARAATPSSSSPTGATAASPAGQAGLAWLELVTGLDAGLVRAASRGGRRAVAARLRRAPAAPRATWSSSRRPSTCRPTSWARSRKRASTLGRREHRRGPRGQAGALGRPLHVGLHRASPEPQDEGGAAARAADPLRPERVGPAPRSTGTRPARRASCSRSTSPARSPSTVSPRRVDAVPRERIAQSEAVRFAGLMTMPPLASRPRGGAAPLRGSPGRWRSALRATGRPRHDFSVLSMGTSQDYEVAVEEGATICGLGTCSMPEPAMAAPRRRCEGRLFYYWLN